MLKTTERTMKTLSNLRLNSSGRPIVFSFFGGSHGYCGEYLTADGRVAFIKSNGDSVRDARETDRVCTLDGALSEVLS